MATKPTDEKVNDLAQKMYNLEYGDGAWDAHTDDKQEELKAQYRTSARRTLQAEEFLPARGGGEAAIKPGDNLLLKYEGTVTPPPEQPEG